MKRVNICMSEKNLEELDMILEKLKFSRGNIFWFRSLSRSDLIRLAVGKYFNLEVELVHRSADVIVDKLKEIKAISE